MIKKIELLDTTLRDGAQAEGISFSIEDKLSIAKELCKLGVGLIEVGNPGWGPKDREVFARISSQGLSAGVVAFGSTMRKNTSPENDPGLAAILESGADAVAIFGKCSPRHVREVLSTTPGENARMIEQSCSYIKKSLPVGTGLAPALKDNRKGCPYLIFDAEHFFDGYKEDPDFALQMLRAASVGGADVLCLCDTNGGSFPDEVGRITALVCEKFPHNTIGIHCHNDGGLAVANTIAAVEAGAAHVQGTLLGFGERCGNASLATIIPNLQLKKGYEIIPDCRQINQTARTVAEICNISIKRNEPYIGLSAFAHKGGMHVGAVIKNPASFEHVRPEDVGSDRRLLLSEVAGKSAVLNRLRELIPGGATDEQLDLILEKLKQKEFSGYQYEGASASFELMVRKTLGMFEPPFELMHYRILTTAPAEGESAAAMVKIRVGQKEVFRSAEGCGPVDALDKALRLALSVFFPELRKVRLTDYKVRVTDSRAGAAATVRVHITSSDGESDWTTVGVSRDIIEASFKALCSAVEFLLVNK